jgi:hypothetical protein
MAAKEGNITPPSWPADEVLGYGKPLPSSNDPKTIPPKLMPKPFAGLPGSTGPRPFKLEGE